MNAGSPLFIADRHYSRLSHELLSRVWVTGVWLPH